MPFYEDSVFGPSEHVQLKRAPSAHSSPTHELPSPNQRRSSRAAEGNDASATRPFRMPREVMSPAPSPIPISPTYHSYRDDNNDSEEENRKEIKEGRAGVSEEEAVADELVLVEEVSNRNRKNCSDHRGNTEEEHERPRAKAQINSIRPHRQPPSERYLSLPRDTAKDNSEKDEGDDGTYGRQNSNGDSNGRRHGGLVSSRPRASPQERGKPVYAKPPYTPSRRSKKFTHDHKKDISSTGNESSSSGAATRYPSHQRASRHGIPRRRNPSFSSASRSSFDSFSNCSAHPHRSTKSHRSTNEKEKYSVAYGADDHQSKRQRRPSSAHPSSLNTSASTSREESRERSPPSPLPPPSPPPAYCDRCSYPLSKEMGTYLQETSTYKSIPPLHCPACGCRLRLPFLQHSDQRTGESRRGHNGAGRRRKTEEYTDDDYEESNGNDNNGNRPAELPRRAPHAAPLPPSHRLPVRNQEEDVNPYSNLETPKEGGDEATRQHTTVRHASAQSLQQAPKAAYAISAHHAPALVPKLPYLTLEVMPSSTAPVEKTKKPHNDPQRQGKEEDEEDYVDVTDHRNAANRRRCTMDFNDPGVPWTTPGCAACGWQCSVALAGICCCCAMPCVLFRERQQLLFHEVESRYICCAGAFPCCVPPASLRPELYYTVKTVYLEADLPQRTWRNNASATAASFDPDRPRYWGNAVEVSRESDSINSKETVVSSGRERHHFSISLTPQPPPAAPEKAITLRSVTGVASPSSLVNPRTGLPLEGCYHNTAATRGGSDGCCDCVTCVDNTCVWNCSRGCCLFCRHPTAHCLASPLCCLCCELTFCVPCALWANRLLIRQHYNLAPDPTLDNGAACCYSCCLRCCTCQSTSVVSQHTMSQQQQQQRRRSSRVKATEAISTLSCWSQLATSVAACLAAVCCLCPCAACSLAQQRDQMERLGFPLVVEVPPEMEMM